MNESISELKAKISELEQGLDAKYLEQQALLGLMRELFEEVINKAEFVWVENGVWQCMWCHRNHMEEHTTNCRFNWIQKVFNKETANKELSYHNNTLIKFMHDAQKFEEEAKRLPKALDENRKLQARIRELESKG